MQFTICNYTFKQPLIVSHLNCAYNKLKRKYGSDIENEAWHEIEHDEIEHDEIEYFSTCYTFLEWNAGIRYIAIHRLTVYSINKLKCF